MKKVIVFGATGNVGSYLTDYALRFFDKKEYNIIASGRRKTDFWEKRGIEYYSVDVTKEEDFSQLPTEDVYAVMLLSAQIPSYMKEYDSKKYIDSIIIGAYNVLEYCRKNKINRIIYTTTVFDLSGYPHEMELDPYLPPKFSYTGDHAVYVIAKNTAIELIKHYHQEYGIKDFIFRLTTIYSYSPYPYYYPKGIKTLRPIYIMINKAMIGETLEVWGNPSYSKDMVHVNDFSQMLCKAVLANLDYGIYNVGTGHPVTIDEQIHVIADVFSSPGNKSKIVYRPDKTVSGGFLMNIQNAIDELGYCPKYNFRDLMEDYKNEMTIKRYAELREK